MTFTAVTSCQRFAEGLPHNTSAQLGACKGSASPVSSGARAGVLFQQQCLAVVRDSLMRQHQYTKPHTATSHPPSGNSSAALMPPQVLMSLPWVPVCCAMLCCAVLCLQCIETSWMPGSPTCSRITPTYCCRKTRPCSSGRWLTHPWMPLRRWNGSCSSRHSSGSSRRSNSSRGSSTWR